MFFELLDRQLTDLQLGHNQMTVHIDAVELPAGTDRSALRYRLNVYVQDGFGSSEFKLASSMTRREEPMVQANVLSEGAFFSINEILLAELTDAVPDFTQFVQLHPNMTLDYYTEAVITNGTTEVSRYVATRGKVINAGGNDFVLQHRNYFTRDFSGWLLPKKNPFVPTYLLHDQAYSLSFLTNFLNVPTTATVEVLQDENVLYSHVIENLVFGQVYSIHLLPSILGDAEHLSVRVVSGTDGKVLFQPWVLQRIDAPRARPEDLVYLSNFRIPVVLPLLHDTVENYKITRTMYEYAASARISGVVKRETTDTRGVRSFAVTVNSSYPEEIETGSMVLSPKFYLWKDNALAELLPTFGDINLRNGARTLQVPLTFELTRDEKIAKQLPNETTGESPTGWRIYAQNCELDAFGKRTGRAIVTQLEEYYLFDNARVIPRSVKQNVPGTAGYIEPYLAETCDVSTTPYLSARIERLGSFARNNCETGYPGTRATITVAAGMFGSEISQADADAKAETHYRSLDTQAFANQAGTCPAASPGLFAQYHDFAATNGNIPANWPTLTPLFTQVDPVIYFFNNFDSRLTHWFTIRWIGVLVGPISGAVTFSFFAEYKLKMRLDGVTIIDIPNSTDRFHEVVVQMVAGRYYNIEILAELGDANKRVYVQWRYAGQTTTPIPTSNYFNYGSD
jgi:hypothetical protein